MLLMLGTFVQADYASRTLPREATSDCQGSTLQSLGSGVNDAALLHVDSVELCGFRER